MKFIVSSSALLKRISTINGVIAPNPVVPILENFLFEIKDGLLKATASDLQSSMTTEIDLEAKEPGSIAIPAKILLETLQNLPEQPVTFTIDEDTYGIELSSDNGRYKLSGENATDFPKLPEFSEGSSVNIPSDILSKAISTTIIAASNDEMRLAMSGILVQ
ncbi:MAG: DNA polymerase III subunit beta, partial [Cytophagales bacterium]|nr:DNA polymerase III subunit beta [Cytophagales bacterium]